MVTILVKALLSLAIGIVLAVGASIIANVTAAPAPAAPAQTAAAAPPSTRQTPTAPIQPTQPPVQNPPSQPTEPQPAFPAAPRPVPNPPASATGTAPAAQASAATSTASATPPEPIQTVTDRVRDAVVNIICTTKSSGPFGSISASGVFIDSRGIILTNAHVGQYFLLKDYPSQDFVSCVIRTGSPAYPRYTARLLYLPPVWIAKNASKITSSDPTGNGEHDYALLQITGTVSPTIPLPAAFPALPISVDPPVGSQKTVLAAYPAGFLGGITISENLYETSAIATVGDLFTFDANTLDLFSVGGTVLSQHGSSGGAVTDLNGVLLGLIVTATDATSTAARDLRAISTPYIIRDFVQETGGTSLKTYLSGDIDAEASAFNTATAPTLTAELVQALGGS